MRLSLFNSWKALGDVYGVPVEFQTSKAQGAGKVFVTYLRDAETKTTIVRAYGADPAISKQKAVTIIKNVSGDDIRRAIQTKEPILPAPPVQKVEKQVDWRDGVGHSYRAQKKIVGEAKEEDDKPKTRNFVAKHARMVNKAGPMRDKKNDYKRKAKHKKDAVES